MYNRADKLKKTIDAKPSATTTCSKIDRYLGLPTVLGSILRTFCGRATENVLDLRFIDIFDVPSLSIKPFRKI